MGRITKFPQKPKLDSNAGTLRDMLEARGFSSSRALSWALTLNAEYREFVELINKEPVTIDLPAWLTPEQAAEIEAVFEKGLRAYRSRIDHVWVAQRVANVSA